MTNIASSSRALAVLALSLSLSACTRTHALGAGEESDAGIDASPTSDAGIDASPTSDARDVAPDVLADAGLDVPAVIRCVDNGISYLPGDVVPRGSSQCPNSCLCLADGSVGHCTGVCPADASVDGDRANLCTTSGGQVSSQLCCAGIGDFPDLCAVGACTCAPASSHQITTCVCPASGCFLDPYGCVGPSGACTPSADQTCNDNPMLSSLHGQCLAGGRCACKPGFTLVAASGKCS